MKPEDFTMNVVLDRIARKGDLFAPALGGKLKLPTAAGLKASPTPVNVGPGSRTAANVGPGFSPARSR
jgi:hypothetical protein